MSESHIVTPLLGDSLSAVRQRITREMAAQVEQELVVAVLQGFRGSLVVEGPAVECDGTKVYATQSVRRVPDGERVNYPKGQVSVYRVDEETAELVKRKLREQQERSTLQ